MINYIKTLLKISKYMTSKISTYQNFSIFLVKREKYKRLKNIGKIQIEGSKVYVIHMFFYCLMKILKWKIRYIIKINQFWFFLYQFWLALQFLIVMERCYWKEKCWTNWFIEDDIQYFIYFKVLVERLFQLVELSIWSRNLFFDFI